MGTIRAGLSRTLKRANFGGRFSRKDYTAQHQEYPYEPISRIGPHHDDSIREGLQLDRTDFLVSIKLRLLDAPTP